MALNHVVYWDQQNWKRITADEAAELFPYSVSAESDFFRCELCGQKVIFVNGSYRTPHFKHNRAEENKLCEDRTLYLARNILREGQHTLPLKLDLSNYKFKLGFISVPFDIYKDLSNYKVTIKDENGIVKVYNAERFDLSKTTYLDVGDYPSSNYQIEIVNDQRKLARYWPSQNYILSANGTVFDGKTGLKLPQDADVLLNHPYLVLAKVLPYYNLDIEVTRKHTYNYNGNSYNLYEVTAKRYTNKTASFFYELHCRLTNLEAKIYPLWPEYIEYPYSIYYNSNKLYMFIEGNMDYRIYPNRRSDIQQIDDMHKIVCIYSSAEQQLFYAGRQNVLKFDYLYNKKTLPIKTRDPEVIVMDINDNILEDDNYEMLPKKNQLKIKCEYDGYIEKRYLDKLMQRTKLKGGEIVTISDLNFGCEIFIFQGKDLIRNIRFYKKTNDLKELDKELDYELYQALINSKGIPYNIPHSFAGLSIRLKDYPLTSKWLRTAIKQRSIPYDAVKILRNFIIQQGGK